MQPCRTGLLIALIISGLTHTACVTRKQNKVVSELEETRPETPSSAEPAKDPSSENFDEVTFLQLVSDEEPVLSTELDKTAVLPFSIGPNTYPSFMFHIAQDDFLKIRICEDKAGCVEDWTIQKKVVFKNLNSSLSGKLRISLARCPDSLNPVCDGWIDLEPFGQTFIKSPDPDLTISGFVWSLVDIENKVKSNGLKYIAKIKEYQTQFPKCLADDPSTLPVIPDHVIVDFLKRGPHEMAEGFLVSGDVKEVIESVSNPKNWFYKDKDYEPLQKPKKKRLDKLLEKGAVKWKDGYLVNNKDVPITKESLEQLTFFWPVINRIEKYVGWPLFVGGLLPWLPVLFIDFAIITTGGLIVLVAALGAMAAGAGLLYLAYTGAKEANKIKLAETCQANRDLLSSEIRFQAVQKQLMKQYHQVKRSLNRYLKRARYPRLYNYYGF